MMLMRRIFAYLFISFTFFVSCASFVVVSPFQQKTSKVTMAAANENIMDCLDPQVRFIMTAIDTNHLVICTLCIAAGCIIPGYCEICIDIENLGLTVLFFVIIFVIYEFDDNYNIIPRTCVYNI